MPPGCTKTPERVYGFNQNGWTKTSRIRTQSRLIRKSVNARTRVEVVDKMMVLQR